MAPYSIIGGVPYGQYLQSNLYVQDLKGEIRQTGGATRAAVSAQTKAVVASTQALERSLGAGFDALSGTIAAGFGQLTSELSNVTSAVESLSASFEYSMGLVLDVLTTQNSLLSGMLNHLDAIHHVVANPMMTQAREFYRIGEERLHKQLLDKALESFLKSAAINDTDFFTQLRIGSLYLTGRDQDDDVVDLAKAEFHLHLAIRYGKAEIPSLPSVQALVAETILRAAFAAYLLAGEMANDSSSREQKLLESSQLAAEALELNPQLLEAQYHVARVHSLLGKIGKSAAALRDCILSDRRYCLKLDDDRDLDPARREIDKLLTDLRDEARKKYEANIARLRAGLNGHHFDPQQISVEDVAEVLKPFFPRKGSMEEEALLHKAADHAESLAAPGTYFDYLDANVICAAALAVFDPAVAFGRAIPLDKWPAVQEQRAQEKERKQQEQACLTHERKERERQQQEEQEAQAQVRREERLNEAFWDGAKSGAGFGLIPGVFTGCIGCSMSSHGNGFGGFLMGLILCVAVCGIIGGAMSRGKASSRY